MQPLGACRSPSYEDHKGDAILVLEGPSRAIAAARDDLDRQANGNMLCPVTLWKHFGLFLIPK